MTIDEILQLAGVAAMTIPTGQLDELASTNRPESEVESLSLFRVKWKAMEKMSYVDDEEGFRAAFAAFAGGRGEAKTKDVSCFGVSCPDGGADGGNRALTASVSIRRRQRL